jgi:carotenoid cleavage dioxygenase-like enzyme
LRNGPNPLGVDDPNYHWFLGAGMVHGVRLRDGKAEWYRNRWVRSKAVAQALGQPWAGGPVHENMDFVWNPAHQARVGLLPRDGRGEVTWIEIDPCWVFHFLNGYDDGGKVVVDLCRYKDSFDVSTLWAAQGPVTLDRWIIDPAARTQRL